MILKNKDLIGSHIIRNKRMSHWSAICEEWPVLVRRYSRIEPGDAAYWFGELTDVAVLGACAWRCGWVSVTESQAEKGAKHRPKHWGRADLYLASPSHSEYVEAKHRRVSLRATSGVKAHFEECFELAQRDAKGTSGREGYDAIGAAFFPLTYRKRDVEKQDEIADLIQKAINDALSLRSHVTAWCFPEETRELSDGVMYWPGVIMLANKVI